MERILLFGSVLCAALLVISLLVRLALVLLRKLSWREWLLRSLSGFGVLFLMGAFGAFAYLGSNPTTIGALNFLTFSYFAGTVLFALLAVVGFLTTLESYRRSQAACSKFYSPILSTWLL